MNEEDQIPWSGETDIAYQRCRKSAWAGSVVSNRGKISRVWAQVWKGGCRSGAVQTWGILCALKNKLVAHECARRVELREVAPKRQTPFAVPL